MINNLLQPSSNGFVTVNLVETLVVDKPMLEKSLFPSSDRLVFLCENPCERAMSHQSVFEQQDVDSKLVKILEFEQVVVLGTKYQYSIEKPQKKYSTP